MSTAMLRAGLQTSVGTETESFNADEKNSRRTSLLAVPGLQMFWFVHLICFGWFKHDRVLQSVAESCSLTPIFVAIQTPPGKHI